ncbi:tRNA dimethylallyltransferase [Blastocystis sp. subtype 4]|uniref:tRNA dimethylallyltransferase n=1 Tax=Blastocystis sp. subtype 4 TaxID=944170 RepID=UPI0007115A35|nr:tRNA dimethylallyltransferase [Blastocystis sp. subtype 4]KNB42321.1 tRNA dimethylallyltransferase [Blastocystis sp. subtype 4]|eukprot:XP_014525764.1 tRNA dimethylallyltransferase [Blastocystis sp. subtype 4]
MIRKKAVFIVGTTGVGKTKLSIQLAHKYDGEVINADAMQMYKGLSVATAKATLEEREGIPHHLLDFVDPQTDITIHEFHDKAVKTISLEGKLPIIVGGTHYYIQSLIWDSLLDGTEIPVPKKDSLDALTTEELYARLQAIDPNNPHHPNQRKRILSDLRLYELTGTVPSMLRKEKNKLRDNEEKLDNVIVWLSCRDDVLHERLDKRVDSMVMHGMLEENVRFVNQYIKTSDVSRGVWQAIGLKEFMPLFLTPEGSFNGRKELNKEDPEVQTALMQVKLDTQQYAKRQITWIRNRLEGRVKHMIQVDTSQLESWDQTVLTPVANVVDHLLDGTLPEVKVNQTLWDQQSVARNTKHECDVCKKVIVGDEQWKEHLQGRVHRRHVQGLKRKAEMEKYFQEKKNTVK